MADELLNSAAPHRFGGTRDLAVIALLAALLCFAGAFLLVEVYDLDVWWQVAIGRDLLQHGRVPAVDYFTATAASRPYHDSHWFFQVLLATADRCGGMVGVQLVMVALWGATLAWVWCALVRTGLPLAVCALLLAVVTLASLERVLPRPELVTFCMIAWFYWHLARCTVPGRREIVLLAVAQALWSNCHGLFVIGPFLVGCYWFWAAVTPAGRPLLAAYSRLLGAVLLATLATPFGLKGWAYALLLFQEAGPQASKLLASVGELSPTFGAANRSGLSFWFYLGLVVFWGVVLALAWYRRRTLPWPRVLQGVALFLASLTGRRNMVLFVLVAAPLTAEGLAMLPLGRWWRSRYLAWGVVGVLLASLCYPLTGAYYRRMEFPARTGLGSTPSFFPRELPAFLRSSGFSGQVFNSNSLGGYYLYHAYPPGRAFTDGRWEIYDERIFGRIKAAISSDSGWDMLVRDFDLRGALLQHGSPEARELLPRLSRRSDWKLVYFDHAASFWVRSSDYPSLPRLHPDEGGIVGGPARRLDDCLILSMFLQGVQAAPATQLRNWEAALAFGQRQELVLGKIGALQLQLEQLAAAEQTFLQLLQLDAANQRTLSELAFIAWQRGDKSRAAGYLQQLLVTDPTNVEALENLRMLQSDSTFKGEK